MVMQFTVTGSLRSVATEYVIGATVEATNAFRGLDGQWHTAHLHGSPYL